MKSLPSIRSVRRRAILLGLISTVATLAIAPTASAAGDNINNSAATTYTVVPSKGRVDVRVNLNVTNHVASTKTMVSCQKPVWDPWFGWTYIADLCPHTTDYYVNTTRLWVEDTAANIKVSSGAGHVTMKKASAHVTGYRAYDLTFPRIFKGQTRAITATYTLTSGAPRSASATRINGGFVNFYAITQPTDRASVKIVLPRSFDADASQGTFAKAQGKTQTFFSGNVPSPAKYGTWISGTDEHGFTESVVTSGAGREIKIQGWPGDTAWMNAVRTRVSGSISSLESVVGEPIPGSGPIVVRETASSATGEYAGFYDDATQVARIAEDYTQVSTVAHELAHAWFNEKMFDANWLSEGSASWAAGAVGTSTCSTPTTIDVTKWTFVDPRSTESEKQAVRDRYNASCAIVTKALNGMSASSLNTVFKTLRTDVGAYPGTSDAGLATPNTWRQWLDAVDESGATPGSADRSEKIDDLLVADGIATKTELDSRASARAGLNQLRNNAGTTWTIPAGVYQPMESWSFDEAETAISSASVVIHDAEAVETALPEVTIDSNPLKGELAAAKTAVDLATVRTMADDQLSAAQQLEATIAKGSDLGMLKTIGLLGTDVESTKHAAVGDVASLDLQAAATSTAALNATLDGAESVGILRVVAGMVIGLMAVVFVGILMALAVRTRRKHAIINAPVEGDTVEQAPVSHNLDTPATA